MIARILIGVLFLLSFVALAGSRNLIRKVFALSVQSNAIVLLFVVEGSRIGQKAPILTDQDGVFVDPLPQALMLTAIVVGIGGVALALALVCRIHGRNGTLDIEELDSVPEDQDHA